MISTYIAINTVLHLYREAAVLGCKESEKILQEF